MNQREYERLKAEAQSEYRRKLEAIETVWKMAGGAAQNGSKPQQAVGKGALRQAVKLVLEYMPEEFSLRDVETRIRAIKPELGAIKRPSLSSALKRLEGEKEIVLVSRGSGKQASKYRRAG